MGADARILWPDACLLCAGGLRDERAASTRRASSTAERHAREHPRAFNAERAGSLSSLNALAVGAALRMLEGFAAGALRQNGSWLRLPHDAAGRLETTYPSHVREAVGRTCCCQFAGLGWGPDGIPGIVRDLAAQ